MIRYAILLVISLILFLNGFFPLPHTNYSFPNQPPTHINSFNVTDQYRPHFTKTVLIVIDALRWDFVTAQLMPLAAGLMNSQGCLSKVSVESPTVTLPRIKALTTGSVPQYMDVVMNLASSEVLADSWLHSAKKKGLRIVFYGDNTWEKLFPNVFTRSEGTTSFFVWDFTEVDDNVTRNVNLELERSDWDVMILHYLGLDHIGHVLGPFHPKMTAKLKEMDDIIFRIQQTMANDTLILVTGDHGMRDAGGHGGTSSAEVTVPLIAIGHDCENASFQQTDIPANLAVLLGINIPVTSIGKLEKPFLHRLHLREYLYALRYNAQILLEKSSLCRGAFLNATDFHENYLKHQRAADGELAKRLYEECSDKITEELFLASSKQEMPLLFVALLSMFYLFLLLLKPSILKQSKLEFLLHLCLVCLQLFAAYQVLVYITGAILAGLALLKLRRLLRVTKFPRAVPDFSVLTCLVHPLTFISTSFIEEEHYFWIFVSVSFILGLILQRNGLLPVNNAKLLLLLAGLRFSMDLNSTVENSVQSQSNWANLLNYEESLVYFHAFFVSSLVLVLATLYFEQEKGGNFSSLLLSALTLCLIYLLKVSAHHNTWLGKAIWALIVLQKLFPSVSWTEIWILSSTLLIKPHNVVLIPLGVYSANQLSAVIKDCFSLTVASYLLSNCFYFLQGHRNSLASVDVSIGYTGLNDYYPFLVISQVLMHTYTFPVLFHLILFQKVFEQDFGAKFWNTILTIRTSVLFFTGLVMILFRHHLFIWSVFAPKLFIESVHTAFMFIELSCWYLNKCVKKVLCK
ncbi:GPI ethanolamine phosphate transferase 2 [Dendroctonus ponderosae]|uniref:GPI ethanolamine phosphate transferase 2 n=1 Tax=Dendroctonus ponderosae TaxID=77166 RepID=UPI002034F7EB|nr:GPI ethanolamine phosphate transferase 2 [Dendroctonus ponderosae]KAH1006187.1 hypothetical protein HUJ05_006948 [Dendroctonus ponderosae]